MIPSHGIMMQSMSNYEGCLTLASKESASIFSDLEVLMTKWSLSPCTLMNETAWPNWPGSFWPVWYFSAWLPLDICSTLLVVHFLFWLAFRYILWRFVWMFHAASDNKLGSIWLGSNVTDQNAVTQRISWILMCDEVILLSTIVLSSIDSCSQ